MRQLVFQCHISTITRRLC